MSWCEVLFAALLLLLSSSAASAQQQGTTQQQPLQQQQQQPQVVSSSQQQPIVLVPSTPVTYSAPMVTQQPQQPLIVQQQPQPIVQPQQQQQVGVGQVTQQQPILQQQPIVSSGGQQQQQQPLGQSGSSSSSQQKPLLQQQPVMQQQQEDPMFKQEQHKLQQEKHRRELILSSEIQLTCPDVRLCGISPSTPLNEFWYRHTDLTSAAMTGTFLPFVLPLYDALQNRGNITVVIPSDSAWLRQQQYAIARFCGRSSSFANEDACKTSKAMQKLGKVMYRNSIQLAKEGQQQVLYAQWLVIQRLYNRAVESTLSNQDPSSPSYCPVTSSTIFLPKVADLRAVLEYVENAVQQQQSPQQQPFQPGQQQQQQYPSQDIEQMCQGFLADKLRRIGEIVQQQPPSQNQQQSWQQNWQQQQQPQSTWTQQQQQPSSLRSFKSQRTSNSGFGTSSSESKSGFEAQQQQPWQQQHSQQQQQSDDDDDFFLRNSQQQGQQSQQQQQPWSKQSEQQQQQSPQLTLEKHFVSPFVQRLMLAEIMHSMIPVTITTDVLPQSLFTGSMMKDPLFVNKGRLENQPRAVMIQGSQQQQGQQPTQSQQVQPQPQQQQQNQSQRYPQQQNQQTQLFQQYPQQQQQSPQMKPGSSGDGDGGSSNTRGGDNSLAEIDYYLAKGYSVTPSELSSRFDVRSSLDSTVQPSLIHFMKGEDGVKVRWGSMRSSWPQSARIISGDIRIANGWIIHLLDNVPALVPKTTVVLKLNQLAHFTKLIDAVDSVQAKKQKQQQRGQQQQQYPQQQQHFLPPQHPQGQQQQGQQTTQQQQQPQQSTQQQQNGSHFNTSSTLASFIDRQPAMTLFVPAGSAVQQMIQLLPREVIQQLIKRSQQKKEWKQQQQQQDQQQSSQQQQQQPQFGWSPSSSQQQKLTQRQRSSSSNFGSGDSSSSSSFMIQQAVDPPTNDTTVTPTPTTPPTTPTTTNDTTVTPTTPTTNETTPTPTPVVPITPTDTTTPPTDTATPPTTPTDTTTSPTTTTPSPLQIPSWLLPFLPPFVIDYINQIQSLPPGTIPSFPQLPPFPFPFPFPPQQPAGQLFFPPRYGQQGSGQSQQQQQVQTFQLPKEEQQLFNSLQQLQGDLPWYSKFCSEQDGQQGGQQGGRLSVDDLVQAIRSHIFVGLVPSADFVDGGMLTSHAGTQVQMQCNEQNQQWSIGGANIVDTDIFSKNAIIHIIDRPINMQQIMQGQQQQEQQQQPDPQQTQQQQPQTQQQYPQQQQQPQTSRGRNLPKWLLGSSSTGAPTQQQQPVQGQQQQQGGSQCVDQSSHQCWIVDTLQQQSDQQAQQQLGSPSSAQFFHASNRPTPLDCVSREQLATLRNQPQEQQGQQQGGQQQQFSSFSYPSVSVCYSPQAFTCAGGRLLLLSSQSLIEQQQPTMRGRVQVTQPLALQREFRQQLAAPSSLFQGKYRIDTQQGQQQQQYPSFPQQQSQQTQQSPLKFAQLYSEVETEMIKVLDRDAKNYINAVAQNQQQQGQNQNQQQQQNSQMMQPQQQDQQQQEPPQSSSGFGFRSRKMSFLKQRYNQQH